MANAQVVDPSETNQVSDNAVGTAIGGALGAIAGATAYGGGSTVIYQPAPTMYSQPVPRQHNFGAFPSIHITPRVPFFIDMNVIRPIPMQVYTPWIQAETWPIQTPQIQPLFSTQPVFP